MKSLCKIAKTCLSMSITLYHCSGNNVICANSSNNQLNEEGFHAIGTNEDDTNRLVDTTANKNLVTIVPDSNKTDDNSSFLSITTLKEDNKIFESLFERQNFFVLLKKLREIIAGFVKILNITHFNENWFGSATYLQTKIFYDEFLKCLKEISSEVYFDHKNWLLNYKNHLSVTMENISDIIESKFELENKIDEKYLINTSDSRLNKKLQDLTERFDDLIEFYIYSFDVKVELTNSLFKLLYLLDNVIEVVIRNPIDENINSLEKFSYVKKKLFDVFSMFNGTLPDSFFELFRLAKISELKANQSLSATNCRSVRLYG
ncbi:hypothetical protein NBO_40g0003 [Nosema bombycis CQ1]|uniref:Uncharacterized protein n=1 Tax=Nosema bombycis (strain CQ1 / CVCC 102059) TaxID=578461 RepID=R0KV35_NOSB1|nr:hypothetical protein NBO_40g0003 [Nosema bombycis CQ1]|eukprot:EOB14082.1 hypothetical protein NBO_40g0003 [Nosema bombycis CQ1]